MPHIEKSQGLAGGLTAQKKQREVYVGNLTIGVVTDNHLKELFNAALSHLVPDPASAPPVLSAQLDPSGDLADLLVHCQIMYVHAQAQTRTRCGTDTEFLILA